MKNFDQGKTGLFKPERITLDNNVHIPDEVGCSQDNNSIRFGRSIEKDCY